MTKTAFLVVAAAFLVIVVPASAGRALDTPGNIRITDRLVKRTHVDEGRHGPGAGDLDFYRQLLFNKGITASPIGHSDLTCLNTGTGSSNCSGTYFLPKGKIMVGGVIASRLFYELAVIGGTGIYDNVRGTVTVTYLGGNPAHEFLLFRLGI
ncbi:MAG TPA: hypothetical protein VH063_02490 [Gaiellaceae bacterium]|jgi:hypothetical protein|nr:hypothetical protein [Gaiellaceae bacterium]